MHRGGAVVVLALAALSIASAARAQYEDWESAEEGMAYEQRAQRPYEEERDDGAAGAQTSQGGGAQETEGVEAERDGEAEAIEPWGEQGRLHLTLEASVFFGDRETAFYATNGIALSPLVAVAYDITDAFRASAQMGLAIAFHGEVTAPETPEPLPSGTAFLFGSPLLAVDWLGATGQWRFRLGAGATLPVSHAEGLDEAHAYDAALGMRGGLDPWLWAPDRISIVLRGRAEIEPAPSFVAGAEGAVAGMLWTGDGRRDSLTALQLAVDGEFRADEQWAFGGRVAVANHELLPDRSELQLSLVPYARIVLGASKLTFAVTVNLDSPYGFAFTRGKVWALSAAWETAI